MFDFGYYNMDCMDGMREFPDNFFDIAVVDPVYGDVKVGGYMNGKSRGGVGPHPEYNYSLWSHPKTDKRYFDELFRVSKNQIIFGGNYFTEEIGRNSTCWIVWDKCNGNTNWADCELAWTSFHSAVRIFRYMWNGMMQGKSIDQGWIAQGNKSLNEKRINPAQKPVNLYRWIIREFIKKYIKSGCKLLDTHVGSASSLIAYDEAGLDYVGFEIDADMYGLSNTRFQEYKAQRSIFKDFPEVLP